MAAPSDNGSSVQVAIRVRPMLPFEGGCTQCIEVLRNPAAGDKPNVIRIGGQKGPTFCFDEAFSPESSQEELYEHRVSPLVTSCLQGYNATTLAYGQTGSGKTFSMTGPTTTMQDGNQAGIIPRAIQSLFDQLIGFKKQRTSKESIYDFEVRIQFLELYGEEIRDLLTTKANPEKLAIRDIGMEEPEVLGATQHKVDGPEDAMLCLARGMLRRVTGSTAMNAESSRSHAILSLHVEQSTTATDGLASVVRSKFHFVDLAGSERQKRTHAVGQRLKEGIDINKGLFVLGNVISALGDPKKAGKTFVPYRDSKLTRLLKGSLGGNHKTLMIACVSPSSSNLEESLNCLRYANRAKNIQNNAVVNVDAGTRLVSELRGQVSALAAELLRIRQGGDPSIDTYSVDMLQSLASGDGDLKLGTYAGDPPTPRRATTYGQYLPSSKFADNASEPPDNVGSDRLEYAENQLEQARLVLKQTTDELTSATEDLFTLRAEREMYKLGFESKGAGDLEMAFVEKAADYEREIATLKEAVQASAYSVIPGGQPTNIAIAQTFRSLVRDEAHLQAETSPGTPPSCRSDYGDEDDDAEIDQLRSQIIRSMSPGAQLEAEERAAEEEFSAITKIFLDENDEGYVDDKSETNENSDNLHKQLEGNLVDLSRNIDEKEALIQQLQQSQKKYATMRHFYEDKLKQMEEQVRERESEREALLAELKKLEQSSPRTKENPLTKELEQRLQDKERHIAGLKKRQNELVNLTGVSSRNETEINRLKNDIISMKTQKVELQKLINAERKSHVGEINRMKKEVMHHDKEANKWKRISDQKAAEAEKSLQVAKSRLEQIGTLKAKYSNAEKQLRVKTVKRGVMEKAGLDSVIVGMRAIKTSNQGSTKSKVDVDAVRDFLDKKVAAIGKKEAIADKLAHEWEDHLELLAKKQALGKTRASKEARQNIEIELKYKEERIRKLAEQLGKQPNSDAKPTDEVSFEDNEFRKLLPEASTLPGMKLTSRILFGMVVRERRRVAALARTASNLNDRLKLAEQSVVEKESAFRSYREEERAERSALAQNQQEQILSLMEIVREDTAEEPSAIGTAADSPDKQFAYLTASMPNRTQHKGASSRMAILANERVEALERQLEELRGERESMEMYRVMEADARAEINKKIEMCDRLRSEAIQLRDALRSIRQIISKGDSTDVQLADSILSLVSSALKQRTNADVAGDRLKFQDVVSDSVQFATVESDSDDEEIPEWAGDIMADLAVIAEGHIPESLAAGIEFQEKSSTKEVEKGSVFERLTNPNNFTGVQKIKSEQSSHRSNQARTRRNTEVTHSIQNRQEERRAISQKVSEQLVDFFQVRDPEPASSVEPPKKGRDAKDDAADSRSVFERLLSPSMYTGTQKGKMQGVQAKKNQQAEELLDEILSPDHSQSSPSSNGDGEPQAKEPEMVDITTLVANKVSEYTQKDVFERLQSNTTHSYAVKHSQAPVLRAISSHMNAENEVFDKVDPFVTVRTKTEVEMSPMRDRSGYTQQNVFERLQRTKTHAFAGKEHSKDGDE